MFAVTLSVPIVSAAEFVGAAATDVLVASLEDEVMPALLRFPAPAALTTGEGRRGALSQGAAARTSTAARSQRSLVGAVSLIGTEVPAAAVVAVWRWVQKVSPLGLRN